MLSGRVQEMIMADNGCSQAFQFTDSFAQRSKIIPGDVQHFKPGKPAYRLRQFDQVVLVGLQALQRPQVAYSGRQFA